MAFTVSMNRFERAWLQWLRVRGCEKDCHPDGAVLWRRRTHATLPV